MWECSAVIDPWECYFLCEYYSIAKYVGEVECSGMGSLGRRNRFKGRSNGPGMRYAV